VSVRQLEEACDFRGAAILAIAERDGRAATRLAALAGDSALFSQAEELLVQAGSDGVRLAAFELDQRGFSALAARLHERVGDHQEAAILFERAEQWLRAAECHERVGRPVDAAKALERGLSHDDAGDDLREALGRLLSRHGRLPQAVKLLQQIKNPEIKQRTDRLVVRMLRDLGLAVAADELERSLVVSEEELAPASRHPSQPPVSARPKRTMFGRYEILRDLAQTPNAQLFEAEDLLSRERVVIKLLVIAGRGGGRDAAVRFEREARALTMLRHPNVVPLLEYFAEGPALVMPFMSSGSLADLLERESIVPARAAEIALAVLSALGEAHRVGILHRDIKPSNVLFDEVGAVRVSDFGAAHLSDGSTTVTAGAIGTVAYMAPEQRQFLPAAVASDLYAVGVLLFEMIAGLPPTFGEPNRLSAHHEELGDAHDAVLASLLAEDPAQRPQHADEAKNLLLARTWSSRRPTRSARVSASVRPAPVGNARFVPVPQAATLGESSAVYCNDTSLARNVCVLPFDERWLAVVRGFAAARSSSLAAVLLASEAGGIVVVEAPRGEPIGDRVPTSQMLGELRRALSELHASGVAHGCVDRSHLYVEADGFPFLAFPSVLNSATPTDDLRALGELSISRR
jgi:tRNA A-37 threonylcarbamoyl transferase component Bud32